MINRESLPVDFTLERKDKVDGVMTAFDSLTYNRIRKSRRIAKRAFDIAMEAQKESYKCR